MCVCLCMSRSISRKRFKSTTFTCGPPWHHQRVDLPRLDSLYTHFGALFPLASSLSSPLGHLLLHPHPLSSTSIGGNLSVSSHELFSRANLHEDNLVLIVMSLNRNRSAWCSCSNPSWWLFDFINDSSTVIHRRRSPYESGP